jgi:CBS domain-containing protein
MSTHPVTLQADSDYKSALRLMQDCMIHHLPVVDSDQQLAGIVAERDLLLAAFHYLGSSVEISEVMQRDVVTVAPDTPVTDAARLMIRHTIGGLPVVDGKGHVVGVITETDIFKAFVALHSDSVAPTKDPVRASRPKGVKPITARASNKGRATVAAQKRASAKRRHHAKKR